MCEMNGDVIRSILVSLCFIWLPKTQRRPQKTPEGHRIHIGAVFTKNMTWCTSPKKAVIRATHTDKKELMNSGKKSPYENERMRQGIINIPISQALQSACYLLATEMQLQNPVFFEQKHFWYPRFFTEWRNTCVTANNKRCVHSYEWIFKHWNHKCND